MATKEKIEAPKGKPKLNYLGDDLRVTTNFTQVPNEILFGLGKYETLKTTDVRVYAVLLHQIKFRLDYNKQVDKDGHAYCFLRQDQLGEKANIKSRKTVGECVERLEKLGLVHAVERGIKKCYMYYIALPDKLEEQDYDKTYVDVDEIGKKLTDEQKAENKAKRESKRATKKQVAEMQQTIQSDDFNTPDLVKKSESTKEDDKEQPTIIEKYIEKRTWNNGVIHGYAINVMSDGTKQEHYLPNVFKSHGMKYNTNGYNMEQLIDMASKQYEVRETMMDS